jgi:hypothetical protein
MRTLTPISCGSPARPAPRGKPWAQPTQRVANDSLPDLQAAVDEVRNRVGYYRRVDIFVVPKSSKPVTLTSYFGVRVLVVEGRAVADITAPATRPQLLFLLAAYFGALKAKHDRWAVVEILIDRAAYVKSLPLSWVLGFERRCTRVTRSPTCAVVIWGPV